MQSTSHGPNKPPRDWNNWTAEDYGKDARASELRTLCIDAIRALLAHQRGSASDRETSGSDLEHLQGRFIGLGIHPGLHNDKDTYYPTTSPLAMVECRAVELARFCGVGMPSQQVFVANLEDASLVDETESSAVAALPPSPEVAEFAASQMYLTVCTDQLDANKEVYGT